jgi:hypothetical protein
MKIEEDTGIRVGDILVNAGILSSEVLQERLKVSQLLGQPLGHTLEQTGDVTRYQLSCAVQLRSLCLDNALSLESAIQAMKMVVLKDCFLEDALHSVGFVDASSWSAKLGELLSDAHAVTQTQLQEGLDIAFREGTPLGQILLRRGWVAPALIARALFMQKQIRAGRISRDEAIEQLRMASAKGVPSMEI